MYNHIDQHVYTSGGTVESSWSPIKDTAVTRDTSEVANYLTSLEGIGFRHVETETLMLKDSRDLTLADQDHISGHVAESPYRRITLISGTYLMSEISRGIAAHANYAHFDRFDKRIGISGSLIPLDGFMMSDGGFNLGMTSAVLEEASVSERVFAVVNGKAIPAHDLRKDMTASTFSGFATKGNLLGYENYGLVPAGGSIDFELTSMDGVAPASVSAIPGFLRDKVKSLVPFEATPPILKDSRDLTDGDISTVVDMIKASPNEHTLITSGLIRIGDLRRELRRGLASSTDRERRIILTGSRYMLRMAGHTDAPYALGYALGKLGFVEPGVHIAAAGRMVSDRADPLNVAYSPAEREQLKERT